PTTSLRSSATSVNTPGAENAAATVSLVQEGHPSAAHNRATPSECASSNGITAAIGGSISPPGTNRAGLNVQQLVASNRDSRARGGYAWFRVHTSRSPCSVSS